jgi:hypothetical protein
MTAEETDAAVRAINISLGYYRNFTADKSCLQECCGILSSVKRAFTLQTRRRRILLSYEGFIMNAPRKHFKNILLANFHFFQYLSFLSYLSIDNKLLFYKRVIKPIWTYGIELWGCASKTNIAIIQRAQSKILRFITNAPWYVSNLTLHKDLKTPYVTETIRENSTKHYNKLENHSKALLQPLLQPHKNRRVKRNWPADLRN